VAATQVYVDLTREVDAWHAKVKKLEDLLATAAWEAHQAAEDELKSVQQDIEGSFKLMEGVVDARPIVGSEDTRFDLAYREFKPNLSLKVEELLKVTENFKTLLEAPPESAKALLQQTVLPMLGDTYTKLYEMDLLTATAKYNKDFDVQKAVTNIVTHLKPFLSVDAEALGEDRRPEHMMFVGVPDASNKDYTDLLTQDKLGVPVNIVNTGDPSRIIAMVTEVGYPSYIITFLQDYQHYYEAFEKRRARGEPECPHLDGRWGQDSLPGLIPAEFGK
jgi:hypothetical protein